MFLDEYETIPFEALNYMVAEANYGGRVTDPMDRRLIKIILKIFYTPKILQNHYIFSPSATYFAPEAGTVDNYKDFIKAMPVNDPCEIFGLHENAEISSSLIETNRICNTILTLLPRESVENGETPDYIIKNKCKSILSTLPNIFDVELANKKHPVKYDESMNTVLQ